MSVLSRPSREIDPTGWLQEIWRYQWTDIFKTSDQTTNTDTTLSDDSTLVWTAEASRVYAVEYVIFYNTPAAADFKYTLTGPASPTLVRIHGRVWDGSGSAVADAFNTAFGTSNAVTSGNTDFILRIAAIVQNGATAGPVAFQWAQNTSNASDTTVYAGSKLRFKLVTSK